MKLISVAEVVWGALALLWLAVPVIVASWVEWNAFLCGVAFTVFVGNAALAARTRRERRP